MKGQHLCYWTLSVFLLLLPHNTETKFSLQKTCPAKHCHLDETKSRCDCDNGFVFMYKNDPRELIVKKTEPFHDSSQLQNLNIKVGNGMPRILLKCNYSGSFSSILSALSVTRLTVLVIDTYLTNTSLTRFDELPFRISELRLQTRMERLYNLPAAGFSTSLRTLHISNTKITSVPKAFFQDLNRLQSLFVIHNENLVNLPLLIDNSSAVSKLFLKDNAKLINYNLSNLGNLKELYLLGTSPIPANLLHQNQNLEKLTVVHESTIACDDDVQPCRKTQVVNLNSSFLSGCPLLHEFVYKAGQTINASLDADIFQRTKRLKVVTIENARLLPQSDLSLVKPLAQLQNLSLISCNLKDISSQLVNLKDLIQVTIGGTNSLNVKNCDTVDTLQNLNNRNVIVEWTDLHGDLLTLEDIECHQTPGWILAPLLLLSSLVFAAVCIVYVRRLLYAGGSSKTTPGYSNATTCEFDVFLSFANEDRGLADSILAALEGPQVGLHCLCHTRDFEPGRTILENIHGAVAKSRMTLLIVSRDFVSSDWCNTELAETLGQGRRVLVVMRAGEKAVRDRDLIDQPLVRDQINSRTYLLEDDANFNVKLLKAVKKVCGSNNLPPSKPSWWWWLTGAWKLKWDGDNGEEMVEM